MSNFVFDSLNICIAISLYMVVGALAVFLYCFTRWSVSFFDKETVHSPNNFRPKKGIKTGVRLATDQDLFRAEQERIQAERGFDRAYESPNEWNNELH